MATLERIRNRAGIFIAAFVGVALFLFVIDPQTFNSYTSQSNMEVAEIAGTSISIQDFEQKINYLQKITEYFTGKSSLDEATVEAIRNDAWQRILRELLLEGEYKKLGLNVGSDEFYEMVQGKDMHPTLRQLFQNPETGQADPTAILQFLKNMENDPSGRSQEIWLYLENDIINEQLFNKYITLVQKGLYVTDYQAQQEYTRANKKSTINYFVSRFNTIPDSAITVSEADLKKYYQEHLEEYKQDETRDIEYVTFNIKPSEKDYKDAEKYINDIKDEFETVEDPVAFVNKEADTPYEQKNYVKGELPDTLDNFMFNAEEGAVFGPYFEDETFKLAKLADVKLLPDSVEARHILIGLRNHPYEEAKAIADSLERLVKSGVDFAMLAMQNSEDPGSAALGGNLGWFRDGRMVPEFNNACFEGNKGEITLVETTFGFHIIEILNQSTKSKKVNVAILDRKVVPSDQTRNYYFSEAGKFASLYNTYEAFTKAFEKEEGYVKKIANNVKESDKTIGGVDVPRGFVHALYEAKENKIIADKEGQAVFSTDDSFIVGFVTNVKEKGYTDFAEIKAEVEISVKKEKKAERLIEQISAAKANTSTLEELATKMNTQVQTANDIRFNSFTLPNAGMEPSIIAAAIALPMDVISDPIQGNNGVYVITVIEASEVDQPEDYSVEKRSIASAYTSRAYYDAFESLKDMAKIEDKRNKFY